MSNKRTELLRTRFFVSANLQYENVKSLLVLSFNLVYAREAFARKAHSSEDGK